MKTIEQTEIPASVLVKHQVKTYGPKQYSEGGTTYRITAFCRYDDECGNEHNSFAITASIDRKVGNRWMDDAGGCCHDEIAKHFPELAPFIKWHLVDSDAPMHYAANVIWFAGDKDCWGLSKGEFRQHTSRGPRQNGGIEGVPNWVMKLPDHSERDVYSTTKPAPITVEWKAYGRTGEGKARELDSARRAAIWPDATDEDLIAPGLAERLQARLPALMAEFKTAMESLGFVY